MNGKHVSALILMGVGLACMVYATYRVVALDASIIPLLPVGLMCTAIGGALYFRNVGGSD